MKRYGVLTIPVLTLVSAALPALLLAGCGSGVKQTLGLERTAPDEFAVVERAPLVVPPNFNLVPPTPGAPRPQETSTTAAAQGLVLGSQSSAPKTAVGGGSKAEQSLLQQAGVAQSDPNIRNELQKPIKVKQTTAQKVGISAPTTEALDPVEEAKKLKQKNVKAPSVDTSNKANAGK